MNCHQILSGACNAGDRCFAIGSVEGIPFTAYAAGCNVVILASTFERVQIIPGASHGYVKISALDCSTDTGKIAAAYENKICIFEPTPVIESSKHNTHFLDYRWVQTGSFTSHSSVVTLSWNLEGTRLLTGGTNIQLWKSKSPTHQQEEEHTGVKFEIGESKEVKQSNQGDDVSTWENIWSCQTAIPIYHMAFSPDGTLFATCGRNDRLVKIWYENKQVLFPAKGTTRHTDDLSSSTSGGGGGGGGGSGVGAASGGVSTAIGELNFTYVYIAHPRAVSNIVWRKTSKYMPKGSVANMLVTSCLDNICRIWIETVLPDDGMVNMTQFDPQNSQNPKFRTHRHKHRFMQRLKHMKTCFHIRRHMKAGAHAAPGGPGGILPPAHMGAGAMGAAMGSSPASFSNYLGPIPSLPSSCSVHDFHSYGFHGSGVTPGMHFHLAASINAETDIPLVPSMQTSDPANQNVFILHWLNNKEMHFTLQAEAILQELTKKVIDEENGHGHHGHHGHGHHGHHGHSGGGGVDLPDDAAAGGGTHAHKKYLRSSKSVSVDDSGEEYSKYSQHTTGTGAGLHLNSMSNTTSQNSLNNEHHNQQQHPITQLVDSLDNKIECLLRDWHQSPDLLFAIHPVDGSYLIWVIEWLDDYYPGSFRQAQVSFSTRIPSAFPLGDAMSMSTTVSLFNTGTHPLAFRDIANNVRSKDEFHKSGQADDSSLKSADQHAFEKHDEEQEDNNNEDGGEDPDADDSAAASAGVASSSQDSAGASGNGVTSALPLNVSPSVSMVTKHSNGTLNLWQLTFAFKTKFTQVLSIGHVSRASGHRFRVNDITCHPVLPLLVSTSHHNLPDTEAKSPMSPFEQPLSGGGLTMGSGASGGASPAGSTGSNGNGNDKDVFTPTGFCSELILWRVDSVGPLCHSGGVSELARINSPEISAFSNVAWIPTLLPSTTLGSYSNSPSACFVASDGENLRVYQAVIDARTLLAEISCSENLNTLHKSHSLSSMISNASSTMKAQRSALHDKLKVVSQQSTARPGCILQLDAISDAKHDWQNTQFLHVFQAQLITGGQRVSSSAPMDAHDLEEPRYNPFLESDMDAIVDLQRNADFEEPFYIVNIEKTLRGSTIHMWRIVISSKQQNSFLSETAMYVPDSNLTQEEPEDNPNPNANPNPRRMSQGAETLTGAEHFGSHVEAPHISITTKKVCTQELPLPEGVDVIHASPAAGHLSSSSIYPACFAPYIIVTACSDSVSRFWKCEPIDNAPTDGNGNGDAYHWSEWKMFSRIQQSAIEIPGQPLNISAAYSGRIACAYKYGKSFTRPNKGDPDSRYVNLCVAIYECESSGGSEWVLEDTIHLKNVHLPRINIGHGIDLSYLHDSRLLAKKQRLNQVLHTFQAHDDSRSPRSGETTPELAVSVNRQPSVAASGLLTVPSFSTLQSLRKSIAENGNTCPLTQKHLVQLDWVSKEDGSHILTVAVGSKILLYTPVSSDIAQANIKAMKESRSVNRPILRKASSLAQPNFVDEIRWMKLRQIDLQTADGLPPLPMQISWVRDGILVVAMDSEMHVYSQWKPHYTSHMLGSANGGSEDVPDTRNLRDEDLRSLANESTQLRLKNVASMPLISKVSTANLQLLSHDKKRRLANTSMANVNGGGGAAATTVGSAPNDGDTGSDDYMTDFGLFQASRIACPVLPQYHPKQLMELLNCGKIRWVKAILAHLVRCMSGGANGASSGVTQDEDGYARQRSWSRSRTLSISYNAADSNNIQAEHRGSTTQIPEELMLDYAEINSIPPLPLWVLLNADRETPGCQGGANAGENDKDYDELFDMHNSEDNLDELLSEGEQGKRHERRLSLPEKQSISHFGPRQGQLLSRLLTHTHLPGLSSLDQMHLLALADTVATCNTDFSDKFAADMGKNASTSGVPKEGATATESLDDCGLRFLLAMKHFTYLLRCLPLQQRAQFQRQGVGTSNIVWAYHSESEEELLNLIPSYTKGDLRWATLRDLGMGYWLKNINTLRRCVERLAKCAYQQKQDPLDAAIYYLAMKKKSLVWGLFRSMRDEKMTAFFGNNFAEDRWRKAALKNAFVLLGKQRFEHAVAFFLLANSLNDAIEVCMNKLEDFQLALIIARLYEGDAEGCYYHKLLHEHVLGTDPETGRCDIPRAHPDPFLRSMTYWTLKKYQESLNTLLLTGGVGSLHSSYREEDLLRPEPQATNPNVFNFYIYLRTHPLLIRQNIALSAQEKRIAHVVLSGFNYETAGLGAGPGTGMGGGAACDKQLQLEDSITPIERQLYFTTAHGHFKSGCPALALEVLNKLPMKISEDPSSSGSSVAGSQAAATTQQINKEELINSGIMDQWGATATADAFDWGAPAAGSEAEAKFEIKWDDDEEDADPIADDDDPEMATPQPPTGGAAAAGAAAAAGRSSGDGHKMDIMAQQLKFVACLKILMEELSTLATGFEVDGGQLRYQLYMWLEREVEALKQLCNYCSSEQQQANDGGGDADAKDDKEMNASICPSTERPTLHEILMQDKQDFEAKVLRAAKRKRWLKANETLLRTLLSYCSLHGASGGGLASVRMELVLLLQELQQEKTQQQLLSPLPFPTTLPLLSACVAGNKTVIADPIKYLQSQTVDMLQSIIKVLPFPGIETSVLSEIFVLRDLAVALSSCIYQSLCDSESFVVNNSAFNGYPSPGMENIAKINSSFECSYLVGSRNAYGRRRKYSTDEPAGICTTPSKWPGVTNLRALLAREKDEDVPKLNVLLLESFVSTYMALFIYSLSTCDSRLLYRLSGQSFNNDTWSTLFGGGMKKLLIKPASAQSQSQPAAAAAAGGAGGGGAGSTSDDPTADENSVWNTVTSITKQRMKLNMKILGSFSQNSTSNNMKEDKPTYREQFMPPETSMLSYFLTKPPPGTTECDDYDTDDSHESENEEEEEDDDDVNVSRTQLKAKDNTEHTNPTSYSWSILRLALIKISTHKIQELVKVAGIELQDLPVISPLSHEVLRTLNRWQEFALSDLIARGPPSRQYIPGCYAESGINGLAIHKYRSLLNKDNTPFVSGSSAGPIRRLWNYLVRQEPAQEVFIKSIFGKNMDGHHHHHHTRGSQHDNETDEGQSHSTSENTDHIRIIHKDHESILSFCLKNNSSSMIAFSNPREIQEFDISLLLESPNWYEDECDYDMMNLSKDADTNSSAFLIIQSQEQNQFGGSNNPNESNSSTQSASQSGRGTSMVQRHKVDNVKRMSAHPLMPLYLTGGQDGSVQIWEWGHQQPVCSPRPSGTFAKVTRCRFSEQGNKFGIGDGDGNLSLWQAGIASQNNRSFISYQCHNKTLSDFVFLGSCSLLASAGQSSENKNINIWDTLLPHKKSCVSAFTCHDQGSSCLVFAPQHQVLISCGKRGDVCVFDVRQRTLRHRYQAHDSTIKCIALDPHEEFFVTGSIEGDIKIWDMNQFMLINTFPHEHAKNGFFKHTGQGVSQVTVDPFGRLFSCGSDGCMKVRLLVEKDNIVHSVY
ncbi:dmX-like protein 2 isoform X1 [Drosophila subobscura]|uniref:dmX-like protein 2 isoform X1 n=1 Tax=Drosophila subobscura TaxID=7241 RepID=UPI00155B3CA7|nr:dmX-like protein 2 isoform X1 [Drosophila subobscura]